MITKTTRDLMAHLTEKEVADYAQQLARITTSLARIENEKKATMSAFKTRLDRATTDASELANKIETREELRKIDCEWRPDYERRTKTLYRLDTGEELETEKMTHEEMQGALPGFERDEIKTGTAEEREARMQEMLRLVLSGERLPLDHEAYNAVPGFFAVVPACSTGTIPMECLFEVTFTPAHDRIRVICTHCGHEILKPAGKITYLDAMSAHDCDDYGGADAEGTYGADNPNPNANASPSLAANGAEGVGAKSESAKPSLADKLAESRRKRASGGDLGAGAEA